MKEGKSQESEMIELHGKMGRARELHRIMWLPDCILCFACWCLPATYFVFLLVSTLITVCRCYFSPTKKPMIHEMSICPLQNPLGDWFWLPGGKELLHVMLQK